ncbi:unnamed protein product [Psylliodes chrysocephalus]|uniref:Uncharacterized protein n=1 Tax=Psylliodes chrysocephalus TaxID=3402493 RepID=A0A9P0G777_9CUCU|nr:unnamed protein product [Psylliodes chrysocephala]
MEEGFNNANNPFGVTNGSTTDNIIQPRSENLLLNTDKFKQNGTDVSPPEEFFEKSNGKRRASEFDDDDEFGPETDVDTVDDLLSPGLKDEVPKSFADGFPSPNNNPLMEGGVFNPFMEHQEKAALEMEKNMRKRETRDLFDDDEMIGRDETPTPPADAVHDVSGLVDSESDEDEWNYIKGEEANKENISPQPEKEVADIPEEDDTMSQLNPNAAEFVPVSPTRSIPSPACRMLINDPIVSQSPKKANDIDISLPNPKDFEREVKSRPSEVDSCNNGHKEDDDHNTSMDLIENILNGKNIDEIPEFQPGSTPKKVFQNEEFHFGPNAAPFSPKLLDQSEALSTKALFGDESSLATVDTSFNESASQDLNILNKESDPMSMSIYADKGESNPFDLDKVQQLPDDLDEFLKEPDNDTTFNETISDLPDHCPLEDLKNNDDILKTTDIDKPSYDDEEKELASPLETEKELINSEENLLEEFCHLPQKPQEFITNIISDSSEVSDLLRTGPENIPAEVELLPTVDLQPFENLSDSNVGLSNVSSERILDSNAESSEKLSDSNIEISNISSEQFRDSSIDISHLVPEKLSDPSVEDSTLLDKSDANIEYLPTEPKPVFNLKSTESSNPGFETESETFEGLQDAVSARSEQLHVDFSAFERPESIPSVCDLEESKSPMPEEPMSAGSEDFTRPEFIQQAQDRFEDLCKPLESPQEEITSSVKDDLSEEQAVFDIAKFASQDEIVKDTFVEKDDVNDIVLHEAPVLEEKEFVKEEAIPPSEPQEELLPLEISSPKLCVCPPKLKEEPEIPFDIKTENISPEFAESAIVTPSEESKTEELIVAQSKNTHSTDNKNVKPLKANVPKVLHDNFEQPRKIRPQVTDYLKNELPICAVLENQDILQDKTTLVPRTFSEKFKCEMPLITSTKSKSKTKISDVCPLSDPISTNLIPKPILDTFKLIMPQTPLASAIAMENKMQKLITPAMGEFNEELRKEHLNDSEMCKSPIDQLKPENIKDQLKCKSLNFIEKELKTLEKGRLMDKASIGKLSALFNQKTEQEIESFDKQTKQICNELVAELSKIVSESNSSKSSVCGNSKYIRPFEIVPEKCLVGDKSESTKSKAKLVLKSELVCSQHVSSVCGCIKSVPNISNIESVHEYTKLNKEFSDLQIKSPILTLGEIYQELQNKKHTSNTDSRITSNLSKDLVKIIDNHLYQTVSNNSGIPQNYDELKIELHSAIHDTEENVDELISEETINTLFLKPRVFDAENSELFVNKNNYYRPDYNYSCLLHDTEQKEDSSLDVKTELIHTENQLACDYSYRLPTGTDQKDSSSDVETESVLFPTFKKQLEGKEKESWSNNKSESHLRKEVHFVSSTCEQVLGQSTKSDEKKVRFSKTEIVCSPSYETQSSEISAQCSVNISAFEEQKDFSSGDKTKSDLKISILVCGKPEVFNDSENVESVLSKDVHLITPKSIPNKICVTNKSYDDSLGVNNQPDSYSYSSQSSEEQKNDDTESTYSLEFLVEDHYVPVCDYSYIPDFIDHNNVRNITNNAEVIIDDSYQLLNDYSYLITFGKHKQEEEVKNDNVESTQDIHCPNCVDSYHMNVEEYIQGNELKHDNIESFMEGISSSVCDYLYVINFKERKQEIYNKNDNVESLSEVIYHPVCDYSFLPTFEEHNQENEPKNNYVESLTEDIYQPVCDYSYHPSFEEYKQENESNKGYVDESLTESCYPVCDYSHPPTFEEQKQEKEPEEENVEFLNEGLYNPVCDYSYLSSVEEHKQEKEPEKENFEILNGGIYNPVCDYSYSPTFGEQKQEIETKIDYIEPLAEGINNPVCDYSYLPSFEEHKQEKKSEEENFEFLNEGIYNPICDYSCSLPFGEHKQEIKSKIKYIEPLAEGINNLVCDYSYLPSFEEHKQEKEPEEDNFEFLNEGIYNPVCDYSYSPIHLEYKQETKPKNDYIEPLTKGINNPVCNYSHLPIFEEQEKSAEENYEFLNEGVYNPVCDYLKTKERRHEKDSSNDDYGEYHTQCIQPVCHYENEYFTDSNYHPVCDYSYQLSIEEQEQDKEPIFKSYIQDIYHPVCDYSYTPPLEYKQENDSLHEYETIYQPVCDYSYIFPIEQHKQENDLENDSAQDAVIFTETATVGKKVNFVQNSDEPIETKDQVIEPEIVCTKVSKKLEDFEISIVKGSYQPICDYSYLLPTLEEKQEKESASGDKSESKLIKLVNFDKEADTIQTSKLKTDEPSQENKLQMSKLVIVYTLRSDVSNDLKNNKSSEIKDANNYKPVYDYSFSVHTSEEHEEEFSIGGTYKPVCDYSYLLSTLEEQKEGSLSGAESNPILTSKDPNISSDPEHNSKMPVSDNTHNLLKFLGNKVDGIATIECISDALAKKKNTEEFLAENVDQHTSEELTKCENDKVLNVNQNITSDVEEPEKEDNNVLEYTNMSQLAESELVNRVAATNECANPEVVPMSILLPDDLKFELISSDKREDNIPEKPICKEIDNKKMEKEPHLSPVSSEEHPTCVYDLSKHIDSAELHEGPLSTEEVQKITELATETTAETLKLKSSELSIDILNGHKPKSQTRDKLELCVGDKPNQTKSEKDIKKIKILYPGSKFMETYNPSSSLLQGNLSANPDSSSISQETLDKFLVAFRQKLVEILVSALLNFKIALVEEMKNIKGINSDDEPAKEQLSETQEIAAEMTAIGVASTIAAGAALTAVLSDTKPKEEEKHEVKESDAVKKTPLKTTPSKEKNLAVNAKSSAKSPAVSSKALPKTGSATTTPKLSARSSKAPTPKTGPTKTSPAATKQLTPVATTKHSTPSVALKSTPKTSLSKTPTKPQPIKSTEKITNGETKTSARPPITRKPAVDPMSKMNSKSTTSTSAPPSRSNVSKFGAKPQQITVTKAPVPPRITPPTSARPISSTTRRAPATTKLPTGTTTEKPTSLGATKPLATARAAPKPAPAVPLKLKPSTTAPTKPRVPLSSKPISKVQPDTEKQIKDSANKITASRSVTQKTGATSARTASSVKNVTSTIHKAETKVNSARTMVSKSTTSTTKSAITKKKPTEVLKTTAIKTKTTKIEKPKQNGISTVVTEEITVVNNTIVNQKSELININNVVDNQQPELINVDSQDLGIIDTQQQEPDLIKDNSPIDNKIIETQQLVD